MKATVDHDLCIGCGLCESICPQVFSMNEQGLAETTGEEIAEAFRESAQEAQEQCPVEAITIE